MASRPDDKSSQHPKRRFPRTRVVWPATLRTSQGTFDCLVLDLSANGAKVQVPTPLGEIEKQVMLSIPRFPGFNATVAWVDPDHGTEMGLTFEDSPEEVAELLASVLPNSSVSSFLKPEGKNVLADADSGAESVPASD